MTVEEFPLKNYKYKYFNFSGLNLITHQGSCVCTQVEVMGGLIFMKKTAKLGKTLHGRHHYL